jgi:hypothetical protein
VNDWASHMLSTEKTLRALNKDLTDRPPAKPFTVDELDAVHTKVLEAMRHLASVATWADKHRERS